MLNFKERPYNLLLLASVALSLLLIFNHIANIQFLDATMFIIPLRLIVWAIPLCLIFFWFLYLMTKQFMYSNTILWTHVLITIFTAFFIVTVLYNGINPIQPAARRYYDTDVIDKQKIFNRTIHITFVVLIFGQFTYIANVLLGLFTNAKSKNTSR